MSYLSKRQRERLKKAEIFWSKLLIIGIIITGIFGLFLTLMATTPVR